MPLHINSREPSLRSTAVQAFCLCSRVSSGMGRLRFELRTNRLKAECSTAELATLGALRADLGGKVVIA
jgi:hypothetical protein